MCCSRTNRTICSSRLYIKIIGSVIRRLLLDLASLITKGIAFEGAGTIEFIFDVKTSNFFLATLVGIIPQIFLVCAIGSGLEKIIKENLEAPGIMDLIISPDIYIPLITFGFLVIIMILLRKKIYK